MTLKRAGIILEFLNASLLWTLGKHLEPHLAVPFLSVFLVYWVPGVLGSLASASLDAKYIVTGASNSVCGLLGAPLAGVPDHCVGGGAPHGMSRGSVIAMQVAALDASSSRNVTSGPLLVHVICHWVRKPRLADDGRVDACCGREIESITSSPCAAACCCGAFFAMLRIPPAGGVLADQIYNWHQYTHHLLAAAAIVVVGAIYILLGFLPYIDNFGHLFGMAAGFFITICLLRTCPVGY